MISKKKFIGALSIKIQRTAIFTSFIFTHYETLLCDGVIREFGNG